MHFRYLCHGSYAPQVLGALLVLGGLWNLGHVITYRPTQEAVACQMPLRTPE